MLQRIRRIKAELSWLRKLPRQIEKVIVSLNLIRESLGRIEARQTSSLTLPGQLSDVEFKVYSQWGEDGIIQYLIRELRPKSKVFVEFGVETYEESNTRFLLVNDNWSGLLIEGDAQYVECIKQKNIYWQRNLKVEHAFITSENINNILKKSGIHSEIGLLSIDVDGNDYWIWKAINCINPAIVICEYNFRFGADRAVTIPYDPGFVRSESHYSMIYYGASLKALTSLAEQKGYVLVGCNSAGNNAFFIRKDLKPDSINQVSVEAGFVQGKYREARHASGELAYLSQAEELEILANLPLVSVD